MDLKKKLSDLKPIVGMIKVLEKFPEYDSKERELLIIERDSLLDLIKKLDDPIQEQILIERYQNGKRWKEIAKIVGYSEKYLFRLHNEAMDKLKSIK